MGRIRGRVEGRVKAARKRTAAAAWPTSDASIVQFDSSTGLASASTTAKAGTVTIKAVYRGMESKPATIKITKALVDTLTIALSTGAATENPKGIPFQLTAFGTYSDTSKISVLKSSELLWWFSTEGVIEKPNADGMAATLKLGQKISVWASIPKGDGRSTKSNELVLSVRTAELLSFFLDPTLTSNITLALGESNTFLAKGTYTDTLPGEELPLDASLVAWSALDTTTSTVTTAATFSGNTLTAKSLPASGSVKVEATVASLPAAKSKLNANVSITDAKLLSVSIDSPAFPNQTIITVPLGVAVKLVAVGKYSNTPSGSVGTPITGKVIWNSDNKQVAVADNFTKGQFNTGILEGQATLSAVSSDGKLSPSIILKVGQKEIKSIIIQTQKSTIAKGRSLTFYAIGTYTDNTITSNDKVDNFSTTRVSWSSTKASAKSVNDAVAIGASRCPPAYEIEGTRCISGRVG